MAMLAFSLVACGAPVSDRSAVVSKRASQLLEERVSCSRSQYDDIWREYNANTALYDCRGQSRSWCIIEAPEPFRSLFELRKVHDVTGGDYTRFRRDAWNVRPACLRWEGVEALQAPGG